MQKFEIICKVIIIVLFSLLVYSVFDMKKELKWVDKHLIEIGIDINNINNGINDISDKCKDIGINIGCLK